MDTSVLIAVLTGEAARDRLIARTQGAALVAPGVGALGGGQRAVGAAQAAAAHPRGGAVGVGWPMPAIPIRIVEVELAAALELADRFGLYAHDAYLMACARANGRRC